MNTFHVNQDHDPEANNPAPQNAEMPKRRGVMKFITIFVFVLIIALVMGFAPRWLARSATERQTAALAEPTVNVMKPQLITTASDLLLPADIRPYMQASIYARTDGYLKRWLVDIGSKVKAGDLLAQIDTPEVDQELGNARAKLVQAQASLKLADVTAKRYDTLRKAQAVSQQDADEKNADRDTASANVQAAEADVKRLEETQGFQNVVAPFDGIISQRNVDVGALIQSSNATLLFQIVQTDRLRVYVQVPQDSARVVKIGAEGTLTLPEAPGQKYSAKVTRNAGSINVNTRTLLVELELDNPDGRLLAGSHAQLEFKLPSDQPRIVVPATALLFRAEGPQIGIVDASNKVQLCAVQIGRDLGKTLEIASGINANDRVIVSPADSLANGQSVQIAKAEATTPAQAAAK